MTDRPRITRHVIAYEHPHGIRRGGVVALSQYPAPDGRAPGTAERVCVLRYVDTVPEGATGRGAAPLLARLVEQLVEPVGVEVYLGLTFGGRELGDQVVIPGIRAALERPAFRRLDFTTYAVDVGPAAARVDRIISVHRRLAAVGVGLELGELLIPDTIARAEDLHRAIRSYNPVRRVTADGRDEWGVDPYEGVLAALTVAFTEGRIGPSRMHAPFRRTAPGYVDLGGGITGTHRPDELDHDQAAEQRPPTRATGWGRRRLTGPDWSRRMR